MKNLGKKLIFILTLIFLAVIFQSKSQFASAAGTVYSPYGSGGRWMIIASNYPGNNPIKFQESSFFVGAIFLDANGDLYDYEPLTGVRNAGTWLTLSIGQYSSLPGATNPIDLYGNAEIKYILDANGNIYSFNQKTSSWSTYTTEYSSIPGAGAAKGLVEVFPPGSLFVMDASGNIYAYQGGSGWSTYDTTYSSTAGAAAPANFLDANNWPYITDVNGIGWGMWVGGWMGGVPGYPGTNPLDTVVTAGGAYILEGTTNTGDIYYGGFGGVAWSKVNTTNYPGNCPRHLELAAIETTSEVLDCKNAQTLNVEIFNDLNENGIFDSGEEFSSFDNSIAEVSLDGSIISPNATGDYQALITASPDSHILAIDPNGTNNWQETYCSFSDGSDCDYTLVGSFYVTNSFSVAVGGQITVYLGIQQNNPPQVALEDPSKSEDCNLQPFFHFRWQVTDPENNKINWFFQVDENPADWINPAVEKSLGPVSTPITIEQTIPIYETTQADSLLFGKAYDWRVKAIDQKEADSGWVYAGIGQKVNTPSSPPPDPSFQCKEEGGDWTNDCASLRIIPGAPVDFRNLNNGYDSYEWDFDNNGSFEKSGQTVSNTFSGSGPWPVTHQVNDNGIICQSTKVLRGFVQIPIWKEILPI